MSKNNRLPQKNLSQSKPTNSANKATTGKEVDLNYLKSFYPKPEKGMKWVYAMTINIQGMSVQAEMIMEVTNIIGEEVKLKVTLGDQSHEESMNINSFAPVPNATGGKADSTGYMYEGHETLNLPYKTLDSSKLSTMSKEGRAYLWLSQGLGPVKFGMSHAGIPASLELKSFT